MQQRQTQGGVSDLFFLYNHSACHSEFKVVQMFSFTAVQSLVLCLQDIEYLLTCHGCL